MRANIALLFSGWIVLFLSFSFPPLSIGSVLCEISAGICFLGSLALLMKGRVGETL